jgi:hypothetical protein
MQCIRKERAGSFQTVGYCFIINKKIHAKNSGLSALPALKRLVLLVWLTFKCVDSLDFFPGELLKYSLKKNASIQISKKFGRSSLKRVNTELLTPTWLQPTWFACCWWHGLNREV